MTMLTFAPGTMCDRRIWEPVWRELGGRFGVDHIPIETQLTRAGIRALFDQATAPVHLIGFSMGGYFSLEYTLEHSERVASLITVGSSAFGLSDAEKAERSRTIAWLETHDYTGPTTTRLNQFIHPSRRQDPEIAGLMRTMDHDLGKDVLIAQLKETTARVSLAPRLKELACSTLFVCADADPFAPPEQVKQMHALAPASRYAEARETGHLMPLEQPEWLARQISDFQASLA
jgi:pimeloyl-ACP methyl ester carboxylesterase